jgi:capsular exopolysaccharide synthesis family protein
MTDTITTETRPSYEPTVLGAIWRYRRAVAAIMLLVVTLFVLRAAMSPVRYVAQATLVVQDPGTTRVFDNRASVDPRRYVADQVAILQSPTVAQRALETVQEEFAAEGDWRTFQAGLDVVSEAEDNSLIRIRYTDGDPELATTAANAFVRSYRDVRREEAAANASSALDRIEESSAQIADQLASVREAINAVDEEASAGLRSEEQALIQRSAELASRRDELVIDAELDSSGIQQSSPAVEPDRVSVGLGQSVALGLILGGALAAGIAYVVALRNRRFGSRYEPEAVTGAPLLADVPVFASSLDGIPVLASPFSAAAEAFRFACTSIQIQVVAPTGVIIGTVSPRSGDGKSVVTANTALALTQTGRRVLLIDADRHKLDLSRILDHDHGRRPGLIDVMNERCSLEDACEMIVEGDDRALAITSFGSRTVNNTEALGAANVSYLVEHLFEQIRARYDYVLIDMPPLTVSALAPMLISKADAAIVVVAHEASVADHAEVAERLRFIGTDVLGYIYNRAPMRAGSNSPYANAFDDSVDRTPRPSRMLRGGRRMPSVRSGS